MEIFITSAILAALGGLGVVAFQEPKLFILCQNWLSVIIVTVVAGCIIWNVSNTTTMTAALYYVPPSDKLRAIAAIDHVRVSDWWGLLWTLVAFAYLLALGLVAAYRAKNKPT